MKTCMDKVEESTPDKIHMDVGVLCRVSILEAYTEVNIDVICTLLCFSLSIQHLS